MKEYWWQKYIPLIPWVLDSIKEFRLILFIRKRPEERKSFILFLTRLILCFITRITLRFIISAHLEKCFPDWYENNKYKFVEFYVSLHLLFTLFIFFLLFDNLPAIFLLAFLSWRLMDIFQSWFSIGILSHDPEPYSIPRMLILSFLSFTEVLFIFGILDFFNKNSFQPSFFSIGQSLYHSVTTITTIGSGFTPIDRVGYLLTYFEIVFGILFLILFIQRIVSLYTKK